MIVKITVVTGYLLTAMNVPPMGSGQAITIEVTPREVPYLTIDRCNRDEDLNLLTGKRITNHADRSRTIEFCGPILEEREVIEVVR